MRIDVITLFPEVVTAPLQESIMGRAQEKGLLQLQVHDLRDYGFGRYKQVDDAPFGGGPGMVLKPEPIFAQLEAIQSEEAHVVLMTPQGAPFKQAKARELSQKKHLIFLCGHYEGVDQRVVDELVDEEISLGDYVLTNGAIAAAVVIDAVVRLLPGALGDEASAEFESFTDPHLLDHPHYTRPANFEGREVPAILLSGNHAKIAAWRKEQAEIRTQQNRPDLCSNATSSEDK